jgi:hypothetical protein
MCKINPIMPEITSTIPAISNIILVSGPYINSIGDFLGQSRNVDFPSISHKHPRKFPHAEIAKIAE